MPDLAHNQSDYAEYNEKLFKSLILIYDAVAKIIAPVRKHIVKNLEVPEGGIVLDVACGTGTQAIGLAEAGFLVTGIDLSPTMLHAAQTKARGMVRLTLMQGDATSLPFPDQSFDAAIISFGLHDMPEEIRIGVLREMKRVTKRGGRVVIADYATPRSGIAARFERFVSNWFESRYYDSYMDHGLAGYLEGAGMVSGKTEVLLAGIAQIDTCQV